MAHRVKLRCDDFDVIGAVPRDLSVIKNFLKRDCAVKRLIDIEEDLMKRCMAARAEEQEEEKANKKRASKSGAKTPEQPGPDPCASTSPPDPNGDDYCDPCRRLKTSVLLEELTKPATFNPAFSPNPPYFDEETVLDSSQPIKYRFRRKATDREPRSDLPSVPTNRTDVMVLANKNDILVWPSQKVAQMNRVPVTLLSGTGDLTEYMLEEETFM